VANLSYADACKELRTSRNPPAPHLASQSTFPPLPNSTVDRTLAKPFLSATPCPHVTGTPLDQDEPIVIEKIDFSSLLIDNPVTFLAFLAEVIKQNILARDKNENIDVCQIITEAAGGRIGLPVDAEQLKLFCS